MLKWAMRVVRLGVRAQAWVLTKHTQGVGVAWGMGGRDRSCCLGSGIDQRYASWQGEDSGGRRRWGLGRPVEWQRQEGVWLQELGTGWSPVDTEFSAGCRTGGRDGRGGTELAPRWEVRLLQRRDGGQASAGHVVKEAEERGRDVTWPQKTCRRKGRVVRSNTGHGREEACWAWQCRAWSWAPLQGRWRQDSQCSSTVPVRHCLCARPNVPDPWHGKLWPHLVALQCCSGLLGVRLHN